MKKKGGGGGGGGGMEVRLSSACALSWRNIVFVYLAARPPGTKSPVCADRLTGASTSVYLYMHANVIDSHWSNMKYIEFRFQCLK